MSRQPRASSSTLRRVTLRLRLSWARWLLRSQERRLRRQTQLLVLEQELAVTLLLLQARREQEPTLPSPEEPETPPLPEEPSSPEPDLIPPYLTEGQPELEPMPPADQEILRLLQAQSPSPTSLPSGAS